MAIPEESTPDPLDPCQDEESRQRFVTTFATQWDSVRILVGQVEAIGPGGPVAALVEISNRLSGLALSLGFPTVSARAAELEELARDAVAGVLDGLRAHVVVDAMLEGFNKDLGTGAPARAPAVITPPLFDATTSELTPAPVLPVPTPSRVAVIADDDPDVTRLVDAQLQAAGYTTFLAFDGDEALAAVRAHAPDVLVLDLMMPKRSGFDVLTELRHGPLPPPRIVVLSGRAREDDVLRVFGLGADDFMAKPFSPQELLARIARLLN